MASPTELGAADLLRLSGERISSTKIYRYDMITAISEKAINKQLSKMHKANATLQTITMTLNGDDYAGLTATLGAPTIQLQLDTNSWSDSNYINWYLTAIFPSRSMCRVQYATQGILIQPIETVHPSSNCSFTERHSQVLERDGSKSNVRTTLSLSL